MMNIEHMRFILVFNAPIAVRNFYIGYNFFVVSKYVRNISDRDTNAPKCCMIQRQNHYHLHCCTQ